jgi:hypothetical protein
MGRPGALGETGRVVTMLAFEQGVVQQEDRAEPGPWGYVRNQRLSDLRNVDPRLPAIGELEGRVTRQMIGGSVGQT